MTQAKLPEKKEKIVYLELLRTIACFLVIVNHTISGVFLPRTPQTGTWWAAIISFFISKTAVPLFLMISGALLLGKVEKKEKHIKRIRRIILDIVIFSFVFYVYGSIKTGTAIDITEFFKRVGWQHFTNAYWYLYLYVGILVMMPLFQRLSANMNRRMYCYLILISVVFLGGMPLVTHYLPGVSVHQLFPETFISVYAGIVFLGYFLAHEVEIKHSYALISVLVFIGMICLQAYGTYLEYQHYPEDYLFYDNRTFITNVLAAAALFYLARWFASVAEWKGFWRCVTILGGCSFGIYLLSDIFIDTYAMSYLMLMQKLHILKATVLYQMEVFGTALAITAVLRQIPIIKKLL